MSLDKEIILTTKARFHTGGTTFIFNSLFVAAQMKINV